MVVLPGEKLSRAAAARVAAAAEPDMDDAEELDGAEAPEGEGEGFGDDSPRRRRRRGGRGRGRSRGRDEAGYADAPTGASEPVAGRGATSEDGEEVDGADEVGEAAERPAPARRVASAFGSVWDSQIGVPASRSASRAPLDEEDFDEPAVPEYLLTERRQRDAGRGCARGGRGGRGGAYAAALERERFGGGRGSTPSRFAEPNRSREGFGRSDRNERMDRGGRNDRNDRQGFRPAAGAPRPSSDEPWSEVPPEIEAMLRAQLGSKSQAPRRPAPVMQAEPAVEEAPAAVPARRGRRTAAATAPEAADATEAPASTATRRASTRRTKAAAPEATSPESPTEAAPAPSTRTRSTRARVASGDESTPATTAKRTSRTRAAAAADGDVAMAETTEEAAAPKRRTTRKKADPAG